MSPWARTSVIRQWATAPPFPVEVTNCINYRRNQVQRGFEGQDLPLVAETAEVIAANRLATKLASDIPAILPEIRGRSCAELGRREVIKMNLRRERLDAVLSEMADHVMSLKQAVPTGTFARVSVKAAALAKTFAPGYGSTKRYMGKISALTELARATKTSLGLLLGLHLSSVFLHIHRFCSELLCGKLFSGELCSVAREVNVQRILVPCRPKDL